ncbi:MAG: tyrosine-type recombinase/integrase [Rhodospirillaceae bacterium]|nr:tyrosine-type recombinase/integrase [Rhodospirillaceae bacterium]
MGNLTVARIQALEKPGMYADGETLYLNVAKRGSKSWIQRITIDGKRRDIGLGPFPLVTVSMARAAALENRRKVYQGGDPLADKRRAKMPTFREAALQTFEAKRKGWKNAKHTSQWLPALERAAFPKIGTIPIDKVSQADVLRVLTPIWAEKHETAKKVRQKMRAVFGYAQAHGLIEHNPAGEGINGALPKVRSQKRHQRALPFDEVAHALAVVEGSRASIHAKACFRFVVLTACRSGEARGARWEEIDLGAREWCIPAERMKGDREHRVPLSDAAIAVLESMRPFRDSSGLVFPSPAKRGAAMSDMTLTKLLRDNGLAERATVHGFRTSFRTWAEEQTNADWAVKEHSLSHEVGSAVERAYNRSTLLEKRRRLMAAWARYLNADAGEVVRLHG